MHEPDKEPNTKVITDQRFTVQWMANISLFGGLALTIIGALFAILGGKFGFFALALPGLVFAIITAHLSRQVPDERARATATLAVVLHIVLFFVLFIIFLFFKEAASAL